ncbi:sucrose-specific PTS transporter subunit IIBC [Brachybacterium sp. DNPG3]
MQHSDVARSVLSALGGPQNIQAAAHCATRLRMVVVDEKAIDQAALDANPDVKGTFMAGGQYQVIIGPGDVDIVHRELVAQGGITEAGKDELKEIAGRRGNPVVRFIKILSDIFVPILPALIAGGLLMALHNVLTAEGLFGPASLVERAPWLADPADLVNLLASAAFTFLPILVAFSAAKRFGANPYLGAALGGAMVMPSLVSGYDVAQSITEGTMTYWDVLGLQVAQAGYQGTVIPILAVVYVLSLAEKLCRKVLTGTFDFLFTPMLSLLATGLLTFIAVGPLMRGLSDAITAGLEWMYTAAGPFGGAIFGAVYSPVVVTGLHQSFPAVELSLIGQGGSFIFPIAAMANIAQGAATLAIFVSLRGPGKLRAMAGASSLSALLGITEPAIFGVNLRLQFPFFIALGAAAVSGALVSIFNVVAVSLGAAGLIGFVSIKASSIPAFLLCAAVSFALSFSATWAYTRWKISRGHVLDPSAVDAAASAATAAAATSSADAAATAPVTVGDATAIGSPALGTAVPLAAVADPMFAGAVLGPGGAVVPSSGPVVSPVDGTVTVAFPTAHAYGITSDDGVEILVHVGLDTVQLGGKHFTAVVSAGQKVSRGDVLAEVDWAGVIAAGYDVTTPVVITNAADRYTVEQTAAADAPLEAGDSFLAVRTLATDATDKADETDAADDAAKEPAPTA